MRIHQPFFICSYKNLLKHWKHVLICGYCCLKLNSWSTSRQLLQSCKSKAAYKRNKQMVILLKLRPNLVICRMTLSNCATQNNVANSNIQVHHLIFIICILYTLFFNSCTFAMWYNLKNLLIHSL